jgi:hypothetical protein
MFQKGDLILLVVGATGQEVMGEFVEEHPTHFILSEPRLLVPDPQNKRIAFYNFLTHVSPDQKTATFTKGQFLTWYKPNDAFAKNFLQVKAEQKLNESGIVTPKSSIIKP